MSGQDFAELLSLVLTAPTIILSVWVVALFYKLAWTALIAKNKTSTQWFVLGIAAGFIGSVMDNLYWGVAWTASFLSIDVADTLFQFGVFSNIPFRQLAGTVAAYCHIRCSFALDSPESLWETKRLTKIVCYSIVIGIVGVSILAFFRIR